MASGLRTVNVSRTPSMCWAVLCMLSGAQLCDFMDCIPPGSCIRGIFQAKILEWVGVCSSSGIFQTQGLNPCLLCLLPWQVDSLLPSYLVSPCAKHFARNLCGWPRYMSWFSSLKRRFRKLSNRPGFLGCGQPPKRSVYCSDWGWILALLCTTMGSWGDYLKFLESQLLMGNIYLEYISQALAT